MTMSLILFCFSSATPAIHWPPIPDKDNGDELCGDLAKAIKSKNTTRLGHIDSSDLTLWKLNDFFPISPEDDLVSHVDHLRLERFSE
ncbi:hypothetical protein B0F90DRAFT_1743575 [Multifurca ochricompacta]|uniref:Uncharacterized protein n=1 Tax=Multifurca ochricompacta TaxID=376703 RepID=A0AAD4M1G3_9AGAM|nr:hypothetical protein B0F90DRAFT_1743575 [Multifurca ochricompacta]